LETRDTANFEVCATSCPSFQIAPLGAIYEMGSGMDPKFHFSSGTIQDRVAHKSVDRLSQLKPNNTDERSIWRAPELRRALNNKVQLISLKVRQHAIGKR
jgi:hypothetical protein